LNPDVLLNQVARANNYDKDIISAIIREMESSMAHQEHMYVHPPSPPTLESSELAWENSILEGHATHPMHKARFALPPLAPIQVGESLRHVKVVFVAVPRSQLQIRGNFEDELAPLVQAIGLQGASSDEVIVPVHSRQLPNIVSRFPFVRLLDGYDMAEAQASLRTVVPDHSPNIQLKLPLGIKVTSALRTITPWTTYLGPGLRPILERIMKDPEACIVVHETSSIVVRDPDVDEAKHLSCLIRESPTQLARARGESVVVCAALTERDANGEFHVNRAWKLNSLDRRLAFLERYVELYLRAIMPPIIEHGFAFEAHQQNTLMRYDPTTGDIKGFMVRDFGGIKAHQDTLFQTTGMRMEAIPDGCAEAESLKEVYNLAYHSIVQMNLHRLIRALGLHYNGMGWAIVRRHMRKIIPRQSELYRLWLESPTVDYKCFVTMKIDGLYRDYLYTSVPNLLLYVDHNQGVSVTAP
ncbi:IucC family-domain-containing protein, partial [Dimargaris cristalligena]